LKSDNKSIMEESPNKATNVEKEINAEEDRRENKEKTAVFDELGGLLYSNEITEKIAEDYNRLF